jgi:hypothetical protein
VILERVLPPLKALETPAVIDQPTGTLSEQGRTILAAMASGSLTPGRPPSCSALSQRRGRLSKWTSLLGG